MTENKRKKTNSIGSSSPVKARYSQGLVIKNTGNLYLVKTDEGEELFCTAKGRFRLQGIRSTSPVVVGDRVEIEIQSDDAAYITQIEDRRNYIVRRASKLSKHSHILAANIDLALLCVTVRSPETTTIFIDRFLVTAEAYRVPVYLVFNKMDIYDADDAEYVDVLIYLYETIGYKCIKASVVDDRGLEEIGGLIENKISLFAGHSGVGKSSIINKLQSETTQKVAEISEYHDMGVHTTTFSEMIALDNGGYVIDTPGIKGFGTIDMAPEEVSHYFPEIFKTSHKCRFHNCMHLNEPDCAVLQAVENHYISQSRYQSYLNILEDVEEGKYR